MRSNQRAGTHRDFAWIGVFVLASLALYHFWGATVGWQSKNLPGGEFRQAQTAITTYFIQAENNYALAYPTPVLGKPWSIPMEFPLYQWTVATLSTRTGLDLTSVARAVSLACFYLTLPAIFGLLGHWRIPPRHRWLALGLILTCPLYIFYSRAFLIETMALMFSVWFLLAFVEGVKNGNWWWLLLANLMGIGAGLVKVTTFMLYLLPAGGWAWWVLYQARSTTGVPGWKDFWRLGGRIMLATALPFGVTLWWVGFADGIKALNPNAEFLLSSSLKGFNFGFEGVRWSASIWQSLWKVCAQNLVWPPGLVVCLGGVVVFGRRWWRPFIICLASYVSVQVMFPQLYAWHDYYSVASGVLLLAALSFGLSALWEAKLPRWVVVPVIGAVFSGQIWLYWSNLYQAQNHLSPGGSGLTTAINHLTRPDDVVVMVGADWSSITPYYARRRALMIRSGMENDPAYMTTAFATLKGEAVGAMILPKDHPGFSGILELAERELGIDPRPVLAWHDFYLYLNVAKREHILKNIWEPNFHEVTFAPGVKAKIDRLASQWYEYATLHWTQREKFSLMKPAPVRFFSTFGPGLGSRLGRTWYNAHPQTQLRFALRAGKHHLRAELLMDAATYDSNLPPQDRTDGVGFAVNLITAEGAPQPLLTRLVDPVAQEKDRGPLLITLDFTLEAAAEVELLITSGPNGKDTRDWALLGPIEFD